VINYHLLTDSVVVSFSGKTFTIAKSDGRFKEVVKAIKNNRLDKIPEIVDVRNNLKKKGFDVDDSGVLGFKDEAMPRQLSDRISEMLSQGLPTDIFVRFWDNLKMNPSEQARQMLYNFLQHNGHPLTSDGCFIAYRKVTQDFKDPHTKSFDNRLGSTVEIPREEVDENPNNTCSTGLHVAAFDYAKDFYAGGRLVEVKVNPRDVVSVPIDYNGTKMRVCRFQVIRECDGIKLEPVYKHTVEGAGTYLVRKKGSKKWKKVQAESFYSAAEEFADSAKGNIGTIYVRKGSNTVQKFEF